MLRHHHIPYINRLTAFLRTLQASTSTSQMSSNAASSPPVQFSDASSDASVDAFSPDASENEDATWDSGRYFSTDEAGVVTLIVPGHLKSQQAVKDFITSALSSGELGAGVRE
ncbi:unnamed protein product, partial [Rhizoctonia solani]